ncbi:MULTISPECIES: translational GTPase TypA [unclassified Modestobacter]|uniref:translational GTPase TypA n=1 Tax=unclassified Modestobacter TaxID=2643866 RepID=UPI0022AA04B8|nr:MULTISPECIES: translational GTPase TypA [unclassified Modestobacter]MCZ2810144.1 translational GTPase TypA [Modestobacter sp. VKM Ac-2979]MCZ2841630.1 translational GTPase TypA [Modestobacter sp. VKM Ac-2980]MCZ2850227.1 translational GTPase TypA [Modestobacter sp. VKM Ac-2978]
MPTRNDLRNVAIIAHVDHGKTTLVDALLRQAGALGRSKGEGTDNDSTQDRVMDSGELERERGITILAKNTAIRLADEDGNPVVVNIVDTPGHADFGGEVERALSMVDGVVLLVDASEGPLPQTRFVLRKALAKGMPVILAVNKTDRQDARIEEVVDETYELFMELLEDAGLPAETLEFPIVYCNGRTGQASLNKPENGTVPDSPDLGPLVKTLLDTVPAPVYDAEEPLRAQVTNLDASPFLGRLALLRIHSGEMKRGQQVAWCKADGTITRTKITELLVTEGLTRTPADSAGPGDLIAIAGIEDIMIGDTLADPNDPRPLPAITVDEPSISITIGINTSPISGKSGKKLTARLIKNRLDQELVGNVSVRMLPTERPDTWEMQGRGELALAILVEQLRREEFELTVGRPQVVTKEIDGKLHEPVERVTIDTPGEYVGTLTQALAVRRGRLENLVHHDTGWARMEYIVPSRGLIGFRTEFLTETRGTGVLNHNLEGYEPWLGDMRARPTGSLVADRTGVATTYSMFSLQERGQMMVEPGTAVYEGMVIGENSRPDDMDVNITKEKKLTNMRKATSEELERLIPPRLLNLEQALEFCAEDECVEVTPGAVRVRKVELDQTIRGRSRNRKPKP